MGTGATSVLAKTVSSVSALCACASGYGIVVGISGRMDCIARNIYVVVVIRETAGWLLRLRLNIGQHRLNLLCPLVRRRNRRCDDLLLNDCLLLGRLTSKDRERNYTYNDDPDYLPNCIHFHGYSESFFALKGKIAHTAAAATSKNCHDSLVMVIGAIGLNRTATIARIHVQPVC